MTHFERLKAQFFRPPVRDLPEGFTDDDDLEYCVCALLEEMQRRKVQRAEIVAFMLMALLHEFASLRLKKQEQPTSFATFCSDAFLLRNIQSFYLRMGLDPESAHKLMASEVQMHYHLFWHERAGKRVYQVASGLAQQLRDTELRGLDSEDLHLPFENIYLEVPPATGFQVFNSISGWHQVEGVYVTEDVSGVEQTFPNGLQKPPVLMHTEGLRSWRLMVVGKSKAEDELDDALYYFNVDLPEHTSLDGCLDRSEKKWMALDCQPMEDKWRGIFQWVLNTILYATCDDCELFHTMDNKNARQLWERLQNKSLNPKKREQLKSELKKLDPQKRMLLGKSIIYVSREQAEAEDRAGHAPGRPLVLRIRVAGHFKRQFHGPKRMLRKRIWIQPYWKGPEDGVLSKAVHKLVKTETPKEGGDDDAPRVVDSVGESPAT